MVCLNNWKIILKLPFPGRHSILLLRVEWQIKGIKLRFLHQYIIYHSNIKSEFETQFLHLTYLKLVVHFHYLNNEGIIIQKTMI